MEEAYKHVINEIANQKMCGNIMLTYINKQKWINEKQDRVTMRLSIFIQQVNQLAHYAGQMNTTGT